MAGYQTIEALRPILHRGPVPMPVVERALVRPLTEKQKIKIAMCELRATGMSQQKIANQFGVSRSAVARATRDVPPPPNGWSDGGKTSKFSKTKAERMHRAGFTFKEIGDDLGCSESNAFLLVTGKQRPNRGRRRPTIRCEEIVVRATGFSIPELRLRRDPGARIMELALARSILFWLIRVRMPTLSYADIGHYLGGFHHTTIMDGHNRVAQMFAELGLSLHCMPGITCRAIFEAGVRRMSAC